jgi:hypothetical protein
LYYGESLSPKEWLAQGIPGYTVAWTHSFFICERFLQVLCFLQVFVGVEDEDIGSD